MRRAEGYQALRAGGAWRLSLRAAVCALGLLPGIAIAQAPETSLFPVPRGGQMAVAQQSAPVPRPATPATAPQAISTTAPQAAAETASIPDLRPQPRPEGAFSTGQGSVAFLPAQEADPSEAESSEIVGTQQIIRRSGLLGLNREVSEVPVFAGETRLAVIVSPRPQLRPDDLQARAQAARAAPTRALPARVTPQGRAGQLCGRPGLVGERLEPIPGRIAGCGIAEPVRLRAVDGITLSRPATINCDTAIALQEWVSGSVVPVIGRTGGGLASLQVAASYSCRTRNNQPGARLSEHSTGNAIDISGFGLANGQEITLISVWRDPDQGPILQRLHRAACGPFGTVLGPDSDRFHQDHFHFDVAAYRSGPYCR